MMLSLKKFLVQKTNPTISVIMPVYNGEKFLSMAIDSILEQSFEDFEFIIIDDGSSDGTEGIIKSYSDPRIVYLNNQSNKGLSHSLNLGIKRALGQYIARMDADDISSNNRFETQINYLEKNNEVDILGSAAYLIDENDKIFGKANKPKSHIEIMWQSLFSTPLIHPTIMGRTAIFKDNFYDESAKNSEDYELWSRLLFEKKAILHNLDIPLINYRVHSKSFTRSLDPKMQHNSLKNQLSNIEHYLKLNHAEKELIMEFGATGYIDTFSMLKITLLYFKVFYMFIKLENLKAINKLQIFTRLINIIFSIPKSKASRLFRRFV